MSQLVPYGPFQIDLADPRFNEIDQTTLWFTDDTHCSLVVGTPGQPLEITQLNLNLTLTDNQEYQFSFELPAAAGGYPAGTYTFTIFALGALANPIAGYATVPGTADQVSWTASAMLPQGPYWVQITGPTFPQTNAISYLMFSATGQANYAVGEFGANDNWSVLEQNLALAFDIDAKVGLQWNFAFTLTNLNQDKADGYCQGDYIFTFNNPTNEGMPSGFLLMPNPNDDQSTVTGNWTGTPLLAGTQPFTMKIPSTDYSTALPVVLSFPNNGTASLVVGPAGSEVVNETVLPISFDDNNAALFFGFELTANGKHKTAQNGGWKDGPYRFHFFLPVWTGGTPDPTELWGMLDDPYKDSIQGDDDPWTATSNPPTEDETAALSHGAVS